MVKNSIKKCKDCGFDLFAFGICINCGKERLRICSDCNDHKKRKKDRAVILGRFHIITSCKSCGRSRTYYKCLKCGIVFSKSGCLCGMFVKEHSYDEVNKAWHQFAEILNTLYVEGRLDEAFPENYKEWCEEIRAKVSQEKMDKLNASLKKQFEREEKRFNKAYS